MQGGSGDELCTVDYGTAAHGQQKINAVFAHNLHTLHQRFIGRIGLNATEL